MYHSIVCHTVLWHIMSLWPLKNNHILFSKHVAHFYCSKPTIQWSILLQNIPSYPQQNQNVLQVFFHPIATYPADPQAHLGDGWEGIFLDPFEVALLG